MIKKKNNARFRALSIEYSKHLQKGELSSAVRCLKEMRKIHEDEDNPYGVKKTDEIIRSIQNAIKIRKFFS